MIKKGLLLMASFMWLQGCVGTVKIAKDNTVNSLTEKTPMVTKGEPSATKNEDNNKTEKKSY
jgi:hypothetical protein